MGIEERRHTSCRHLSGSDGAHVSGTLPAWLEAVHAGAQAPQNDTVLRPLAAPPTYKPYTPGKKVSLIRPGSIGKEPSRTHPSAEALEAKAASLVLTRASIQAATAGLPKPKPDEASCRPTYTPRIVRAQQGSSRPPMSLHTPYGYGGADAHVASSFAEAETLSHLPTRMLLGMPVRRHALLRSTACCVPSPAAAGPSVRVDRCDRCSALGSKGLSASDAGASVRFQTGAGVSQCLPKQHSMPTSPRGSCWSSASLEPSRPSRIHVKPHDSQRTFMALSPCSIGSSSGLPSPPTPTLRCFPFGRANDDIEKDRSVEMSHCCLDSLSFTETGGADCARAVRALAGITSSDVDGAQLDRSATSRSQAPQSPKPFLYGGVSLPVAKPSTSVPAPEDILVGQASAVPGSFDTSSDRSFADLYVPEACTETNKNCSQTAPLADGVVVHNNGVAALEMAQQGISSLGSNGAIHEGYRDANHSVHDKSWESAPSAKVPTTTGTIMAAHRRKPTIVAVVSTEPEPKDSPSSDSPSPEVDTGSACCRCTAGRDVRTGAHACRLSAEEAQAIGDAQDRNTAPDTSRGPLAEGNASAATAGNSLSAYPSCVVYSVDLTRDAGGTSSQSCSAQCANSAQASHPTDRVCVAVNASLDDAVSTSRRTCRCSDQCTDYDASTFYGDSYRLASVVGPNAAAARGVTPAPTSRAVSSRKIAVARSAAPVKPRDRRMAADTVPSATLSVAGSLMRSEDPSGDRQPLNRSERVTKSNVSETIASRSDRPTRARMPASSKSRLSTSSGIVAAKATSKPPSSSTAVYKRGMPARSKTGSTKATVKRLMSPIAQTANVRRSVNSTVRAAVSTRKHDSCNYLELGERIKLRRGVDAARASSKTTPSAARLTASRKGQECVQGSKRDNGAEETTPTLDDFELARDTTSANRCAANMSGEVSAHQSMSDAEDELTVAASEENSNTNDYATARRGAVVAADVWPIEVLKVPNDPAADRSAQPILIPNGSGAHESGGRDGGGSTRRPQLASVEASPTIPGAADHDALLSPSCHDFSSHEFGSLFQGSGLSFERKIALEERDYTSSYSQDIPFENDRLAVSKEKMKPSRHSGFENADEVDLDKVTAFSSSKGLQRTASRGDEAESMDDAQCLDHHEIPISDAWGSPLRGEEAKQSALARRLLRLHSELQKRRGEVGAMLEQARRHLEATRRCEAEKTSPGMRCSESSALIDAEKHAPSKSRARIAAGPSSPPVESPSKHAPRSPTHALKTSPAVRRRTPAKQARRSPSGYSPGGPNSANAPRAGRRNASPTGTSSSKTTMMKSPSSRASPTVCVRPTSGLALAASSVSNSCADTNVSSASASTRIDPPGTKPRRHSESPRCMSEHGFSADRARATATNSIAKSRASVAWASPRDSIDGGPRVPSPGRQAVFTMTSAPRGTGERATAGSSLTSSSMLGQGSAMDVRAADSQSRQPSDAPRAKTPVKRALFTQTSYSSPELDAWSRSPSDSSSTALHFSIPSAIQAPDETSRSTRGFVDDPIETDWDVHDRPIMSPPAYVEAVDRMSPVHHATTNDRDAAMHKARIVDAHSSGSSICHYDSHEIPCMSMPDCQANAAARCRSRCCECNSSPESTSISTLIVPISDAAKMPPGKLSGKCTETSSGIDSAVVAASSARARVEAHAYALVRSASEGTLPSDVVALLETDFEDARSEAALAMAQLRALRAAESCKAEVNGQGAVGNDTLGDSTRSESPADLCAAPLGGSPAPISQPSLLHLQQHGPSSPPHSRGEASEHMEMPLVPSTVHTACYDDNLHTAHTSGGIAGGALATSWRSTDRSTAMSSRSTTEFPSPVYMPQRDDPHSELTSHPPLPEARVSKIDLIQISPAELSMNDPTARPMVAIDEALAGCGGAAAFSRSSAPYTSSSHALTLPQRQDSDPLSVQEAPRREDSQMSRQSCSMSTCDVMRMSIMALAESDACDAILQPSRSPKCPSSSCPSPAPLSPLSALESSSDLSFIPPQQSSASDSPPTSRLLEGRSGAFAIAEHRQCGGPTPLNTSDELTRHAAPSPSPPSVSLPKEHNLDASSIQRCEDWRNSQPSTFGSSTCGEISVSAVELDRGEAEILHRGSGDEQQTPVDHGLTEKKTIYRSQGATSSESEGHSKMINDDRCSMSDLATSDVRLCAVEEIYMQGDADKREDVCYPEVQSALDEEESLIEELLARILRELVIQAMAPPAVAKVAAAGVATGKLQLRQLPLTEEDVDMHNVAAELHALVSQGLSSEQTVHGKALQVPISTYFRKEEEREATGHAHETGQIWRKLLFDVFNERLLDAAERAMPATQRPLHSWITLPETAEELQRQVEDACGHVLELVDRNAQSQLVPWQLLFSHLMSGDTEDIEEVGNQLPRFSGNVVSEVADRILVGLIQELL